MLKCDVSWLKRPNLASFLKVAIIRRHVALIFMHVSPALISLAGLNRSYGISRKPWFSHHDFGCSNHSCVVWNSSNTIVSSSNTSIVMGYGIKVCFKTPI